MQLRKMCLNINGAERMFVCDPASDTLATVLRRLGLTGTKVGCGIGVCGSCSVLLDGKLVRSCTKKMKNIKEYSEVLTIEGIGNPRALHPLQQAWITYGGVQCGFCTPGFIVSAYALLQENLSPSREQVRDWFQEHKNVCRCTGYKQLVDAVMAAAAVMRGEMTMDDITYHGPTGGQEIYGGNLPRPAALAKVCGVCDFGDDIALKMPAETLHAAIVQPKTSCHAKILAIHTEEAERMPGVVRVLTAKDVQGTNRMNASLSHPRRKLFHFTRPIICDDKIFRYGDVVAMVVADTRDHARAAAKKVTVDLVPLPEYMNYLQAAMPDAIRLHEEAPNIYLEMPAIKGEQDTREVLDNSAYVVEGSFYSSREPHLPIEGDMVQSYWGDDGMLTVQGKAQAVYGIRFAMAKAVGIDMEKLRIIQNPTGGSFGYGVTSATFALAAVATMATGMPVSLSLSYEEHMHFSGKRSSSYANARLGCDEKGKITALEYDVGLDHGCYPDSGDSVLQRFVRLPCFPYDIPNASILARLGFSNHTYGVAYRSYGAPQTATTGESLVDMLAEKAGIDPFEFRYRNIAREGATNLNSAPYYEYPGVKMMDVMRPYYEAAVQRAKNEDKPELRRGVGLAWGGHICTAGPLDHGSVDLELNPDGTFTHYGTWEDVGQGGDIGVMTHVLMALRELGITEKQVHLVMNDSKICPDSGIAASSRSHIVTGIATIEAANKLMAAMRKPDGSYRTYDEMEEEGIPTRYSGHFACKDIPGLTMLDPNTGVGNPNAFYMYALFLAEVAVETATGKTTVLSMLCVDDVGLIGNALSVDGQAFGGMSHSIGFALSEDYEDVKRHNNIKACGIPYIKDIPDDIRVIHTEGTRTFGPYGSSGCSEAYQASGHVAVLNAIHNACGVRIFELPATAAKVKDGIDKLSRGEACEPPQKYYLGEDMYDQLDDMQENPVYWPNASASTEPVEH